MKTGGDSLDMGGESRFHLNSARPSVKGQVGCGRCKGKTEAGGDETISSEVGITGKSCSLEGRKRDHVRSKRN